MTSRGIVTLADANYFEGLLALHRSVQSSWPCTVHCFDIGLTPEQRSRADALENLTIADLPADHLIGELDQATRDVAPLAKRGKRLWPLWICPLLIKAAPFEELFWLDCDILVLRGLDELFGMLADGPVFTPENKAPGQTANKLDLYRLLPIWRGFDPAVPAVNAGVSGWRKGRDDAALDAYHGVVAAAAARREVMEAIAWHDQGALIWAIQSLGLEHRVLSSPMWNLCVDHVRLSPRHLRWDEALCSRLRARLPSVRLVHWNGCPVPWSH